ncbi:hypothetical protein C1H46_042682 [Malus baccata]|uniref:Uncharacterized protein n=1 Tax=Malus baccata TaxID=106549 RepID=A0A540KC36_MALBA|nr:hypothetical protein C1H46_042682 [Malus baccata]
MSVYQKTTASVIEAKLPPTASSFLPLSGHQHGHNFISTSDFFTFAEIFTDCCRNGLLVDDVDESISVSSGHAIVLGSESEIGASSTSTV